MAGQRSDLLMLTSAYQVQNPEAGMPVNKGLGSISLGVVVSSDLPVKKKNTINIEFGE